MEFGISFLEWKWRIPIFTVDIEDEIRFELSRKFVQMKSISQYVKRSQ